MLRQREEPGKSSSPRESEPASGGLSDEDCFVLARSGDHPSQAEMVARYMPRIFNLFSRCLGDRELAADGTQEVFLRVFREADRFDARRSFKGWIFAIAWNLARDHLRRKAARRKAELRGRSCRSGSGGGEDDGEPVDSREASPLDLLERKEEQDAVRHALARLDPRQRALLVLREFEDLSYEELSELFGCPVGTIKSGIHRARLDLKNVLLALQPWRYS